LRKLFYLLLFFLSTNIYSQIGTIEEKIENQESRLNSLRQEIRLLELKLEEERQQELSELDELETIEKQIGLIKQLINELLIQAQNQEKKIEYTKDELAKVGEQLKILQELVSKRMVYVYKHGKISDLELILTAKNINQVYVRWRYLQLIAQQDKRDIANIKEKQQQIENLKKKLEKELLDLEKTIQDRKSEELVLQDKRSRKGILIEKIRKNKQQLQEIIEDKKAAAEQLRNIIEQLEKERKRILAEKEREERERRERLKKEKAKVKDKEEVHITLLPDFEKNKGKLPWPVSGKIESKFGKQINPILKTVTFNQGIDIKANSNSPVIAVAKGKVTTITYIRGYGNTLILDHDGGYYTVYSHIDDIKVSIGEIVQSGQQIAAVSESGSLEGTILHFELYGGQKVHDPEDWLK
jgi:septal ring factor EnvC (AmiA/AmiB activator)